MWDRLLVDCNIATLEGVPGNPLGLIILVLWLLTLIVAPIVSRLLAMAVSRKREYLADAMAAQFTRNPAARDARRVARSIVTASPPPNSSAAMWPYTTSVAMSLESA